MLALVAVTVGCQNGILDSRTKKDVEERLQQRSWLPEYKTAEMTTQEQQAMDFLYAWLCMGDVADFPADLFYQNVKSSLQAREEMKWNVPDDLFLHFVLPVRVNNENLDVSRPEFYAELKERVKDLPMEEAILEVNHWCHEKAVYSPTDARTLSPSAMVKTATGRCGEESTFCVAALRSVGIPARQIYTPRWAHSDDNHAWVEAWANGKWYYIGACEPEARLNHGWFDSPARRGLIMFTKVFGNYYGEEEVINRADGYTEINVTSNYAPVKKHYSVILDSEGNAVEEAEVLYTIYNYAEFYPAVTKKSDESGVCSMVSGLGDMTVWASKDGKYGFGKIDPRVQDTIFITLNKDDNDIYPYDLDIVPPVEVPVSSDITKEEAWANRKLMAKEDSIRNAYVATFMNEKDSREFANGLGLDADKVWYFISNSRGNWQTICQFLKNAENKERAMLLLDNVSVKDLKDTPIEVFEDHLKFSGSSYEGTEIYGQYVLSPRIDYELITGYREPFQKIHEGSLEKIFETVAGLQLKEGLNPANLSMTPEGVIRIGMGDKKAIERTAIALVRSAGIPSRREPISEKPQYYDGNGWKYISFPQLDGVSEKIEGTGTLKISFAGAKKTKDPHYYTHYTIGKITEGRPRLIELEHSNSVDMGDDGNVQVFGREIPMPAGTYQLISGTRMADGSVLCHSQLFKIEDDKCTQLPLILREKEESLQVIGNIDVESLYVPEGATEATSLLATTGRGYYIMALIDAKKEPTTHMLRALESLNEKLTQWNRKVLLILRDKESMEAFKKDEFPALPASVMCYGYDAEGKTTSMIKTMLKADVTNLPVLVVADSFGRVVYTTTGYNTTTAEHLEGIINQLSK